MTETYDKSSPKMLGAIPRPISSQESGGGLTVCGVQDGPTTDLFGQEAVPVSPSAQPGKDGGRLMSATCGLIGFLLSESASLQQSLESRLMRQLDGAGSTLFSLTWKRKATPAGRPYFQLVASGRRTSGNDCGSWATPNAAVPGGTPDQALKRKEKHSCGQSVTVLDHQVQQLASWSTPNGDDANNVTRASGNFQSLARQSQTTGPILSGSPARTESRGQLNPRFSLWLMGYPEVWAECAPAPLRRSKGR